MPADSLRARAIKLAHTNPDLRNGVLAAIREAMEFPSDEARKKYLKDHPGADPAKHTVTKSKEDGGEKDKGTDKEKGKSKQIKSPQGGEHSLISAAGGNTVFMGSYTATHIKGHNQPGKGSVFSKDVDIEAIVSTMADEVPAKFFADGGGIHTIKVPGVGRDLVKKVSDIREKYPNAQELEVEKQEGVVMEDGPDGKKVPKKGPDGKTIPNMVKVKAFVLPDDDDGGDWTQTDQMNIIMRPANPNFMPDEAKADAGMKEALEAKKGFAVLSAFPGNPDVPKASEWKDDWAVIVPNGGKGADADIQKALKGKKASLREVVIRLAAAEPTLRRELLPLVSRVGMEFPSDEARKKYLKEHPDADKSKHTVKKQDNGKDKSNGKITKKMTDAWARLKDVTGQVTEALTKKMKSGEAMSDGKVKPSFLKSVQEGTMSAIAKHSATVAVIGAGLLMPGTAWASAFEYVRPGVYTHAGPIEPYHIAAGALAVGAALLLKSSGVLGKTRRGSENDIAQAIEMLNEASEDEIKEFFKSVGEKGDPDIAGFLSRFLKNHPEFNPAK
jgi:hypothetical protein